jgi:hypothetical protein
MAVTAARRWPLPGQYRFSDKCGRSGMKPYIMDDFPVWSPANYWFNTATYRLFHREHGIIDKLCSIWRYIKHVQFEFTSVQSCTDTSQLLYSYSTTLNYRTPEIQILTSYCTYLWTICDPVHSPETGNSRLKQHLAADITLNYWVEYIFLETIRHYTICFTYPWIWWGVVLFVRRT